MGLKKPLAVKFRTTKEHAEVLRERAKEENLSLNEYMLKKLDFYELDGLEELFTVNKKGEPCQRKTT